MRHALALAIMASTCLPQVSHAQSALPPINVPRGGSSGVIEPVPPNPPNLIPLPAPAPAPLPPAAGAIRDLPPACLQAQSRLSADMRAYCNSISR